MLLNTPFRKGKKGFRVLCQIISIAGRKGNENIKSEIIAFLHKLIALARFDKYALAIE
jgi:hypothetical protein